MWPVGGDGVHWPLVDGGKCFGDWMLAVCSALQWLNFTTYPDLRRLFVSIRVLLIRGNSCTKKNAPGHRERFWLKENTMQ